MRKDTNFLKTISSFLGKIDSISSSLVALLSKSSYGVYQDSRSVYSRDQIVKLMVLMKLLNISSIHRALKNDFAQVLKVGKDVFYKVQNCPYVNWRKLLLKQSVSLCSMVENQAESCNTPQKTPCFILDDTIQVKRGKVIELIGKVFNHCQGRHVLGFNNLHLAIWNGWHLYHLDFSIHISLRDDKKQGMRRKDLNARYRKDRPEKSAGAQRLKEAIETKIQSAEKMLRRIVRRGLKAPYLLADSWFFCEQVLRTCRELKLHLICAIKRNKWLYEYEGKSYTINQLIKKLTTKKNRKKSRKYNCYYVKVNVFYKGTPLALHFFKQRYRGAPWKVLGCSQTSLPSTQVYALYHNRWAIEVSFKELKQLLGYGKCQSRDFMAHISSTTQSLLAYNYLAHLQTTHEHLTIGGLFREVSQSWIKPSIMQKIWIAFFELFKKLGQWFKMSFDELLEMLIEDNEFIATLKKLTFY